MRRHLDPRVLPRPATWKDPVGLTGLALTPREHRPVLESAGINLHSTRSLNAPSPCTVFTDPGIRVWLFGPDLRSPM